MCGWDCDIFYYLWGICFLSASRIMALNCASVVSMFVMGVVLAA